MVEEISRQCDVESVWLSLGTLMQVYDVTRTRGSERNTCAVWKEMNIRKFNIQPRHVLTENMRVLRRLASLRQDILLLIGTMKRVTLGQYPIQLSFQLEKKKGLQSFQL